VLQLVAHTPASVPSHCSRTFGIQVQGVQARGVAVLQVLGCARSTYATGVPKAAQVLAQKSAHWVSFIQFASVSEACDTGMNVAVHAKLQLLAKTGFTERKARARNPSTIAAIPDNKERTDIDGHIIADFQKKQNERSLPMVERDLVTHVSDYGARQALTSEPVR